MFKWIVNLFKRKKPDDVITGRKAQKVISGIEKTYWLSEHNVVHNSLCKWYRNCEGKEWDGNKDGVEQCGLCGGNNPIVHRWNLK